MTGAPSPDPTRTAFVAAEPFALDRFQVAALDAIDAGRSVLVAAPTGSGKTVVAEYAVARALAEGRRAFYTTPIKALSNQKFADLCRRHGAERVGLLTGDNSINGDAPVVVMTTEVLRNMIYAGSGGLDRLRWVVLDEVHYLQDQYRGPVWEEVIIHTPAHVGLVCLSATVSNAEELADWITTVRGPTATVIEDRRPVDLINLCMIGDRTSERLLLLPTLVDGRPNPEAARLDTEAARARADTYRQRARRRLYTPGRLDVVERLDDEGMLPAIYFIFSRQACTDAAAHCLDAGVRLTSGAERDRVREIVHAHVEGMDDHDLAVLGFGRFLAGLEAGIAAHHAGMVPPFKEAVEACFVDGLVKVVFATETLALGINMPARSVVIEKLTKFTGERHQFLTPGEYTQLTGRAGRRGIDSVGYAAVLWSPFVPFEQLAGLVSSRTYGLVSAFRPTYNMAANLVRNYPAERAHHLLNLSFAQYEADREVVRLEARLDRRRAVLADLRATAESPYGDLDELRRALPRDGLRALTTGGRATPSREVPREAVRDALARLRPGHVIWLHERTPVVVVTVGNRRGGVVKLTCLSAAMRRYSLGEDDFDEPPVAIGAVELPTPYAPNRQAFLREAAKALQRARLHPQPPAPRPRGDDDRVAAALDLPVAADPRLAERLRAAAQADRVEREVRDLEATIRGRTESIARRFDRILRILGEWGYLDGWALSASGERLARLFHECDLLVAEVLAQGLLDDLDPAALAGLASVFTYEHRSPEPPPAPWFPSPKARRRWEAIVAVAEGLRAVEAEAGLPQTRMPDPTFLAVAYAWAAGEGFGEVVADEDLSGGDFVRNTKQLIDLLRQVGDVAPVPATARAARAAADALFRGVVAASSRVSVP